MMNIKLSIFVSAVLLLLLSSCKPKQNINYMGNIESVALETSQKNSSFTIQPSDQLIISISAKDMDVVKPFNQNYSSGEVSQFSLPNSNLPVYSQNTVSGPTYIVDSNGNFDFPILGIIKTNGKSIETLQEELKDKVSQYVKNPGVNVRNGNFKVTVLGEVSKPGQYMLPDGQPTTILSALGLAGDLTIYGKRDNILIVRNVNGTMEKQYIDLTDANFINSPYYYVRQNDVIYVTPNVTKEKASRLDPNMPIYLSVASVVVTILALVFRK